jgi:nicotinate-nucleotide pyrophosphorylase (carboxylating)
MTIEYENYFYTNIIEQALLEDLGWGDLTTDILISPSKEGNALVKAKSKGILAGTDIFKSVFFKIDPQLKIITYFNDGKSISPGDTIAKIQGKAASILKAERVALNFLQHLSGIATQTSQFVEAVKGLPVKIVDTRKTIPGLRYLEKEAVTLGGGYNHRLNLSDSILIKNNHLSLLTGDGLNIAKIISRAKQQKSFLYKQIEIEVTTIQEVVDAVKTEADIIMLDNMNLENMREAVRIINKRALVEASGGISLDNVRTVAETGVDIISVGAITHSAKALDINLNFD